MKIFKLAPLLIFLLTSALAHAGNEGGGGKSVVCRDDNHKIISVKLLDLWEGENIYRFNYTFHGDVDSILAEAEEKLKQSLEQPEVHLFPLIERVKIIMNITSKDVIIKDIDDVAEIVLPRNCKLEQLANYVDDELIVVSGEIWEKLSPPDKAGLILHEAIYRFERENGATNSRRARKVVAYLLSPFLFSPVYSDLPPQAKPCVAVNKQGDIQFKYWVYPAINSQGQLSSKLQFSIINGKYMYSKNTVTLPWALPWELPKSGVFASGNTVSSFEDNVFISLGGIREVITIPDSTQTTSYFYIRNAGKEIFETYCEM